MKKILSLILSATICFCTAVQVCKAEAVDAKASGIEISEETQIVLDNAVNVLIDIIHRVLVTLRFPWEPKKNTVDMSKFTLTFEEEFDETELNRELWWNYHPGIRKGGYWDKSQSFLDDGNLVIRAEHKENGPYGEGYYCDRVDTRGRFEQKYGYFECRCILPAAQGLWSAFWLSSTNINEGVPGTQGTEIDVFESPLWYRGNQGKENGLITSNLHYGGYSWGHRYKNVTIAKANNPYEQYNTYGVEWNEDEYIFYVNGVETGRSSFGGVSKVPQYLLLSVEVDGAGGKPSYGWSGKITRNNPEDLPADFIVDYVRAYQYSDLLQS